MIESKKDAQHWISNTIEKYNCHHKFTIRFEYDKFIVFADFSPDDQKWRRTWEYIVPFKSLANIKIAINDNPVYQLIDIEFKAKLFRSFKKINLNEQNNLNTSFEVGRFIKESKVSDFRIILSNDIVFDNEFDIDKLNEAFRLAIL